MKRNERTPNEQRIYKSKRANYLRVFDLSDGHHSTPDLSFQNIEFALDIGTCNSNKTAQNTASRLTVDLSTFFR